MKLTYHEENGYLPPNVTVPVDSKIGIWGKRRADYLKKNRRPIYTGLQLSGKLNAYLVEVDRQAGEKLELLIRQMAEREGVAEELKAKDQMAWVGAMNSIRNRAMEIVNHELIYV